MFWDSFTAHNQDDVDNQLIALLIINELLSKLQDPFLEQFLRLGLPVHIANLIIPPFKDDEAAAQASIEETLKVQLDISTCIL